MLESLRKHVVLSSLKVLLINVSIQRSSTGGLPRAKQLAADAQSTSEGDQEPNKDETAQQGQAEQEEEIFVEEVYKGSHTFLKVVLKLIITLQYLGN